MNCFLSHFISLEAPSPCPQMSAKDIESSTCPSSPECGGLWTNGGRVLIGCGFPRGQSLPTFMSGMRVMAKLPFTMTFFLYLNIFHISLALHHSLPQRRGSRWREKPGDSVRVISLERRSSRLNPGLPEPRTGDPSFIPQQMKMAVVLNWGWYPLLPGDIFVCHKQGEGYPLATGVKWVEAKDIAKHLPLHKTAHHSQESASPKGQQCWGWDALP